MNKKYLSRISVTVFALMFLFLGAPQLASAATFTVTKTADTNDGLCNADCSLREAVIAANSVGSDDTIDFAPALTGQTITLVAAFGDILIVNAGSLSITGPGANKLTINGGAGANRIFTANAATFSLSGVTLTGGNGGSVFLSPGLGGAVLVAGGTAQFNGVHFTNNTGATVGGAVFITGGTNHLVTNSAFSTNSAANVGALHIEGSAPLTVTNSTFSGNTTPGIGGALGAIIGSVLTTRNVTIAGNTAASGGGVFIQAATFNFGNTIIAGNTAATPEILFVSGTVTSAGNNLVGDSPGDSVNTGTPVPYQGSDFQNISPQLMGLGDYGGPTPTRALQFSSPARNNGSDGLAIAAGLTTDQRGPGYLRFVGTVDIGAFEAQDTRLYVTKAANSNDGLCNADCSLREAIVAAPNGASIDFSRDLAGQTLVLGGTEININKVLTIDGFGANLLTISGGLTSRIFSIATPVTVRIRGIKLTNGNSNGINAGFGGAVFVNSGNLVLDAVDITNNSALNTGGGVFIANSPDSRIAYSTISFNTAGACAGVFVGNSTLYVVNSTFSDNITSGLGGGLCVDSGSNATVRNATIAGNSAGSGGGILLFSSALNLGNTIVAGNFATGQPEIQNNGAVTSAGNNLVGDSAGDAQNTGTPIAYQASDVLNQNPVLLPLTIANGGTTPTRAVGITSPAIDRGSNALAVDPPTNVPLLVDQRGFTRIVDGNGDTVAVVDIGAFEFGSLAPTAAGVSVSGRIIAGKRGVANARITMMDNEGNVLEARSNGFGLYSFDSVTVGTTYIVTVTAKGYQFSQRVINVDDAITDLNFYAEQQ